MVDGVDDKFSLVNRLKSLSLCFTMPIGKEAADEIERLQERVRELEGYLAHQWDDSGERCIKCGDKDWMASRYCGVTTEAEKAVSQGDNAAKQEGE